jgi:hypothetical protein
MLLCSGNTANFASVYDAKSDFRRESAVDT